MQYQPFRMEFLRGKDMFVDALSRPPAPPGCSTISSAPLFTLDSLCIAQRSCPGLKQFYTDQALLKQYNYFVDKQVLRLHSSQVIVPRSFRRLVLHHFHDSNGHQGHKHTSAAINSSFLWPNMNADIKNYVSSCNTCQSVNPAVPSTKLPLQSYSPPALVFGD